MATKTLEYIGPFQGEVVVQLADGPVRTTDRRVEVDAAQAALLLEQPDNWALPTTKKKGA